MLTKRYTDLSYYEVLVESFSRLSDLEKSNLIWHVDKGTTILCGNNAVYFTKGGGLWPASMAWIRETPDKNEKDEKGSSVQNSIFKRMQAPHNMYYSALRFSNETQVREAIIESCDHTKDLLKWKYFYRYYPQPWLVMGNTLVVFTPIGLTLYSVVWKIILLTSVINYFLLYLLRI